MAINIKCGGAVVPRNDKGVLLITLNEPDRSNVLSEAMLETLSNAFDQVSEDAEIRVIILSAEGKVFCAGHDLKEMTAGRQNADQGRAYFTKILCGDARLLCRKLSPVQNQLLLKLMGWQPPPVASW